MDLVNKSLDHLPTDLVKEIDSYVKSAYVVVIQWYDNTQSKFGCSCYAELKGSMANAYRSRIGVGIEYAAYGMVPLETPFNVTNICYWKAAPVSPKRYTPVMELIHEHAKARLPNVRLKEIQRFSIDGDGVTLTLIPNSRWPYWEESYNG